MRDEHDKHTAELIPMPKPFDGRNAVKDRETEYALSPKGARQAYSGGIHSISFVPVAFAAKDWSVTPRRIRALLAEGRLAGQMQPNGYWEVRFPYLYTFGTRGPSLKRQQRPKKRPRTTEGKAA